MTKWNDISFLENEKFIREEVFNEHIASMAQLNHPSNDSPIEILIFAKPNSTSARIDFVCLGEKLFVSGDYGTACYQYLVPGGIKQWATCDVSYFHSKCISSPYGADFKAFEYEGLADDIIKLFVESYDYLGEHDTNTFLSIFDTDKELFSEIKEEFIKNGNKWWYDTPENDPPLHKQFKSLLPEFFKNELNVCDYSENEFTHWVFTNMDIIEYHLGENWAEGFPDGKKKHIWCLIQLAALKLAMTQIKENEKS